MDESDNGRGGDTGVHIHATEQQSVQLAFNTGPGFVVQCNADAVRVGLGKGEVKVGESGVVVTTEYEVVVGLVVGEGIGAQHETGQFDPGSFRQYRLQVFDHLAQILL